MKERVADESGPTGDNLDRKLGRRGDFTHLCPKRSSDFSGVEAIRPRQKCRNGVDEQAWRQTAEILDRALRELMEVAAASRERPGGEDGIPVVTAMAAFEAPPPVDGRGPE
jgi:hypothetical protein